MIKIEIPEFDFDVTYETLSKIPYGKSGIYILFDRECVPLYVGQSNCIRKRVYSHFHGTVGSNTSRYSWAFYNCKAFIEDDQTNKNIYELYLINKLHCPLNIRSNSYGYKGHNYLLDKADPDNLLPGYCKFILKNGQQCAKRPTTNGFCYLHGGNEKTRKAIAEEAIIESMNLK